MKPEEAREVLELYLPGSDAGHQPEVAAALAEVERDAGLREWWEQRQMMHRAMRGGLLGIPAPEDLRERIINAHHARAIEARSPLKVAFKWAPVVLAAAASLVLLLVLNQPSRNPDSFDNYRDKMARVALREYRMDLLTNDVHAIQLYLEQHSPVGELKLGSALQKTAGVGGAVLRWHGRAVSLVCLEAPGGNMLWCFVTPAGSLRREPLGASVFAQVGKMSTLSWREGEKIYVLASLGDEKELRKFL